jgi:hypothetical protein
MPMRGIMRGIAALTVPAVLVGMALATATGVEARGGGCGAPAGPPSIQVQGCINSSAGNVVNADGWVTMLPGPPAGGCSIVIHLDDANTGLLVAQSGIQGCTAGHHIGRSIVNQFGTFVTVMILDLNNVVYRSVTNRFTCQPNAC